MTFPVNPTNGEKANVNGVTYTYSSARSAWTVTSNFLETFTGNALVANTATVAQNVSAGTISAGNVTLDALTVNTTVMSNLVPGQNEVYDLGTESLKWRDLYLSGNTINLGNTTLSADGGNLLLPSTVQIGQATISANGGNLSLPENVAAAAITVSGNVAVGRNKIQSIAGK